MATHEGASDAELVRRSQGGDLAAFDQLVRRHEARAINVAYRTLGDLDAAHDAAQEAFVAAWRSLRKFKGQSAFGTWLYRILHNACLDHIKRRKRRGEVSLDAADDDNPGPPEPADPALGPEGELDQDETQQLVHKALARLPDHHRQLLILFDIQGMTYQEICDIVGLPMGTVKSRLNRARHALRRELEPLLEQDGRRSGRKPEGESTRERGESP
ncbi:MAG: sigma-70 family RNA polymerase sigma factor [Armatimonadia bacterium]|nr:sigma-70 family RNA polymerase sigma factor [Armatimonadia bacterium]